MQASEVRARGFSYLPDVYRECTLLERTPIWFIEYDGVFRNRRFVRNCQFVIRNRGTECDNWQEWPYGFLFGRCFEGVGKGTD